MKTVFRLEDVPYEKNSVVTVGSFDGMHRGHQRLLQEVVQRAQARKGRSVVVTFEPHPKEVLTGRPVHILSTLDERREACEMLGIDLLFAIEFTYEFSRQPFREFYERYLIQGVGVSEVVEGYDHHFGRDREGSVEELVKLGREFEFSVVAVKPIYVDEEIVSSSMIRKHLTEGRADRAERLLGRPHVVAGVVVRGDGRGRRLGYPTANLDPTSKRKIVPQDGIYFVRVKVRERMYYGMASIGVRPTFATDGARTVEVNILDFDGDLYGEVVELHFLKRLRDELKFDTPEELVEQMNRDKEETLKLIERYGVRSSATQP